MNKNTVIGLLVIGLILFGFSWWNNKEHTQQLQEQRAAEREQFIKDSTTFANLPKADTATLTNSVSNNTPIAVDSDSTQVEIDGILKARTGTEEFKTLENELFKLTFSNKGGRIAAVELKNYKRYNGDPLTLFTDKSSHFGLTFFCPEQVNTIDMYMEPVNATNNSITYRLSADSTNYMDFIYSVRPNEYMMDMSIDVSNFKGRLSPNQYVLKLDWNILAPQQEKGFKNENNYTTIAYKYPNENDIEDIGMSDDTKSESISTKVEWVGFKQQFFSSVFISDDAFNKADIKYTTPNAEGIIKSFNASLELPYQPDIQKYGFKFYFGPNLYPTLNDYKEYSLHKLVPLGWGIFGWVNRFLVIPTFDFLGRYISNFGIIILLMTLLIKLLILPMTYKSYMSTAKMRLLKPDMDKINDKYPKKEDALKKQQATMDVYKRAGVSPMGGCIPMLVQLPILYAMFRFFPSAIELRQKSFLWADDLSSYDSIFDFPGGFSLPLYGDHISLFTLLMAVTIYISSRINMAQQTASTNQVPGMKFMMLYMMPIMLLFMFNNYASGLSWYYFLSTLLTIATTYIFRFAIDDNKLHQKMQNNAKKPVKKSKWAIRLEDIQKQASAQQQAQQQAQQRAQQKAKNK